MSIVLTEFSRTRLFPREPRRNTIQDVTPEAFEQHLNAVPPVKVLEGYAPFCKLHVHRNWTSTRCIALPITDDNRHLLRSDYEARTTAELPVLVRWFEGVEPPVAEYLIAILYDREQLAREGTAIAADWGVVGCMYTAEPEEGPHHHAAQRAGRGRGRLRRAAGPRRVPAQRRVLAHARELARLAPIQAVAGKGWNARFLSSPWSG